MEEWKDITDYPGYRISNSGVVWSNKLKRVLVPPRDKDGYERIGLWKAMTVKKCFVHQLVALHFIPNPENKPTVNHINGDKLNNNVFNLEWATMAEQNDHKINTLGNGSYKGIHTKSITLTKDGVDYTFTQTRDAVKFLKTGGSSWKKLTDGLKDNINGFKIKTSLLV